MTTSLQSVDADGFKQSMRRFVSGVTVVTTASGGTRTGITVSAFTSLSLDPPLVLICIDRKAAAHDLIQAAGRFVVNILSAEQESVSNRFASREEDKFAGIAWHEGKIGLPVLDDTLAAVECELHETLPGGDHSIFVGRVVATELSEGAPLLYGLGGYQRIAG